MLTWQLAMLCVLPHPQATTENMAYMIEYTSGVVCVGMEGADLDRLKLPLMVCVELTTQYVSAARTSVPLLYQLQGHA